MTAKILSLFPPVSFRQEGRVFWSDFIVLLQLDEWLACCLKGVWIPCEAPVPPASMLPRERLVWHPSTAPLNNLIFSVLILKQAATTSHQPEILALLPLQGGPIPYMDIKSYYARHKTKGFQLTVNSSSSFCHV